MKIRRYEIDICDGCMTLQGEMCHTPGCVFIRERTDEIKEHLSRLLLRIEVDGGVVHQVDINDYPVVHEEE